MDGRADMFQGSINRRAGGEGHSEKDGQRRTNKAASNTFKTAEKTNLRLKKGKSQGFREGRERLKGRIANYV